MFALNWRRRATSSRSLLKLLVYGGFTDAVEGVDVGAVEEKLAHLGQEALHGLHQFRIARRQAARRHPGPHRGVPGAHRGRRGLGGRRRPRLAAAAAAASAADAAARPAAAAAAAGCRLAAARRRLPSRLRQHPIGSCEQDILGRHAGARHRVCVCVCVPEHKVVGFSDQENSR